MNKKVIAAVAAVMIAAGAAWAILSQKPLAPDVTVTTLKGEKLALSSLRGKVVLVNFWATTCTSCVAEMPHLTETWKQYSPQGYEMVAVAMDYDPAEQVKAFVARTGLPFTVAMDAQGEAAKAFGGVRLTPTSFLIDKEGHIVQQYLGEPEHTAFQGVIESLLKKAA